jgi:hypothetical protein
MSLNLPTDGMHAKNNVLKAGDNAVGALLNPSSLSLLSPSANASSSSLDAPFSSRSTDSVAEAEMVQLVQFDNLSTILKHLLTQQTELRHSLDKTKYETVLGASRRFVLTTSNWTSTLPLPSSNAYIYNIAYSEV